LFLIILWRESKSGTAGANAQSTFCWIFLNHHICAYEVGNTKRAIDAWGLHEPGGKFIESEGREGYVRVERGATSLVALSLIFTFPLIFTWTGKLDTMLLEHFSLKQLSRVANKIRSDTYWWHTLRCVVMAHFFPSEWISAIDAGYNDPTRQIEWKRVHLILYLIKLFVIKIRKSHVILNDAVEKKMHIFLLSI